MVGSYFNGPFFLNLFELQDYIESVIHFEERNGTFYCHNKDGLWFSDSVTFLKLKVDGK